MHCSNAVLPFVASCAAAVEYGAVVPASASSTARHPDDLPMGYTNGRGFLRYFSRIASAIQYASAPTGPVGLYPELCGKADAPVTNRFGISQLCRYLLSALVPGS